MDELVDRMATIIWKNWFVEWPGGHTDVLAFPRIAGQSVISGPCLSSSGLTSACSESRLRIPLPPDTKVQSYPNEWTDALMHNVAKWAQ